MKAAELSIKGNYGHCLGKTMDRPLSHGIFGDNIFSHIISRTASACDARMGGAMIPVMSNSGSRATRHLCNESCGGLCAGERGIPRK